MSEPPYALGIALCLLAAFRLVERPRLRRAALLGLAIGLTALVRTEALGLLVLLALPVRNVRQIAVMWLVALVAVAPWCIRNSTTFDRPVLISTEDGPVIAGANCPPSYHGRDTGYWRADCVGLRDEANPAVRSSELRSQGIEYARDHAGRVPAVEVVRLLRTFGLWQPVRHVYFAEGRETPGRPVAVVCTWLVLAGGLAGAWMLRRRRELIILLSPLVLAVGTTLIAFGYPRFRYAADVGLIVLAGYAAARRRSALSRT